MDSDKKAAEIISQVEEMLNSPTENGGIFFSKYGMWLNETLPLINYNFEDNQLLEYRTRSNQVLIRIYISTYDLTFAVKALSSQTGAGILYLIFKTLLQL
jgi:mevalonate kinase